MAAADLSLDLWTLIMRHLPLGSRLGSASLVSTRLYTAAVAATDELSLVFQQGQEQRWKRLERYLEHNGSQLSKLCLRLHTARPLAHLQSCKHLVHLDIEGGGSVPCSILPSMQQLTHLGLHDVRVEDVHHISCLRHLAVLHIEPGALCTRVHFAPDITSPPFALASLLDVSLGMCVVLHPGVLSAASNLTRLKLEWAGLGGQTGGDASGGDASGGDGGALLLEVLGKLRQLDTLVLGQGISSAQWTSCSSTAFTALLASSKLQTLSLDRCGLPAGALKHVFAPGAPVHAELTSLVVREDGHALEVGVVCEVVRCCPGLQSLDFHVGEASALAALPALTALTRLFVVDASEGDGGSSLLLPPLGALTSLCALHFISYGMCLDWEGEREKLDALTALRELTRCQLTLHDDYSFVNEVRRYTAVQSSMCIAVALGCLALLCLVVTESVRLGGVLQSRNASFQHNQGCIELCSLYHLCALACVSGCCSLLALC